MAIVADAHVGQRAGDAERMVALVESLPDRGVGELILLGDAFRWLVGYEVFWSSDVRRVLAAWREVRDRGVRVSVLEGNRDFFLDAPALAPSIDWSGLVLERDVGGRRFRLDHGDRVNQRDLQYRFWRRVSKSGVARLSAHLLPGAVARRIVASTERRLAETNRKFRDRLPERALRRQAEAAWRAGIDVLMWGHFHRPWTTRSPAGEAVVLPAWLETGEVAVVEPDGSWRLERWP